MRHQKMAMFSLRKIQCW